MPTPRDNGPGGELADILRRKGISDPGVLDAIARFDRRRFLPPDQRSSAIVDRALPIGLAQTISQPFVVAVMTTELALAGGDHRVLEIGTGSGYQTAILSRLARRVFTIERHSILSLRSRSLLDGLKVANVSYRIGDGSLGWPEEAPFDRILVSASSPELPPRLFAQLSEGGIMVAPLGKEDDQFITVVTRREGRPVHRKVLACRFVRLIGEGGWASESGA